MARRLRAALGQELTAGKGERRRRRGPGRVTSGQGRDRAPLHEGPPRPVLPPTPALASLKEGLRFPHGFWTRGVDCIARELLGACLISTVGGRLAAGVVVETEAYGGPDDPASHAATRTGTTERNRAMFGPAGRAYVYRSYGVHWCMNVVTGVEGRGEAVLLRGLTPVEGIDVMQERRRGREPLGAGPGRLAQALAIDDALYGHDLDRPPLVLHPGWTVEDRRVRVSGRVGVSVAADRPLRFYLASSSGVSKPGTRYGGVALADLPR